MSASHAQLSALPTELLVTILEFLNAVDLARCRQISCIFNSLIEDTAVLQYTIELAFANMEDLTHTTLNSTEKLKLLRAHQSSWRALEWDLNKTFSVPLLDGPCWEVYGGVLVQVDDEGSVQCDQLPADIRGIPRREWTLPFISKKMVDIAIDPSQDLLAALESNDATIRRIPTGVSLFKLSTGKPHRSASEQDVSLPLTPSTQDDLSNCGTQIELHGPFLGVMSFLPSYKVDVWHWPTQRHIVELEGTQCSHFAFLSDRYLAFVDSVFPDGSLRCRVTLRVIDLERASARRALQTDLEDSFSFLFPVCKEKTMPWGLELCADPAPRWRTHINCPASFQTAQDSRVLVLTAQADPFSTIEAILPSDFVLLVSTAFVLKCLAGLDPETTAHTFSWEEWGPRGSRMLRCLGDSGQRWPFFAFGTRVAALSLETSSLLIYDINDLTVRRGRLPDECMKRVVYCTAPSTIRCELFQDPVTTALPYRRQAYKLPFGVHDSVALSENNVVLIHDAGETLRWATILTI